MKTRGVATALLIALALLQPTVAVVPGAAAARTDGFRPAGELPLKETERVIVDERAGKLVALGGGGVNVGDIYLRVTLYDARSLKRVRSAEWPPYLPQVTRVGSSPQVFAFDHARRLLHVLAYRSRADQQNTANPHILSIDVDTLKIVNGPEPLTIFPRGVRLFGASVWPSGRIGLVGQVVPEVSAPQSGEVGAPAMFGVMVGEIDPATADVTWGPAVVRGCQTAISDQDQAAIAMGGDAVFVGCGTGTVGTTTAPGTPAVVAIERDDPTRQRLNVLPGSYAGGDSYLDSAARRLLLVGRAGDRPAQAVWIFDIAHEVFVGVIAAGDFVIRGFGVDPRLGRLYISIGRVAERGALLVSSDRGIDIPQAQSFEVPAAGGPIVSIPSTHTVIVPVEVAEERVVYRAYRDTIPASAFTVSNLFDYSTYDALSTQAQQFEGDVQSFGVRLHLVGGVGGLAKNAVYLDGANYWPFAPTGLKDGDRDLYLARVTAAHLSQDEASAAAIRADRDDTTDSDYRALAARSSGAMSEAWPFGRAECRDFGAGSSPGEAEGSNARCAQRAGTVAADASYAGADVSGLVSVGWSSSTAGIMLDKAAGLVAEATAETRNVVIGNEVHIGRIASQIRVAARGTAGSSTVSHVRSFEGVSAPGYTCASECDPFAVARVVSEALGAQFRVEIPAADTIATKGGAHAHVLREPWTHQQDVVLSSQDPTEQQVPALRITYIGDNAVASRLMVEFAGAMGAATYLRAGKGSAVGPGPALPGPLPDLPTILPSNVARPGDAVSPKTSDSIIRRIVRGVRHGWRLAFGMGPRSVALWTLLLFPAFLLARRRQLIGLVRGNR